MASDVIMPQMGFDMTEGMVVRWLKQEGDTVTRGEAIAEIETDKATVELEAYESGVMARILVPEGVVVPVGQPIGLIAELGEDISSGVQSLTPPAAAFTPPQPAAPTTPPPTPSEPTRTATVDTPAQPTETEARTPVTPVARRIAEQAGVAVSQIQNDVTGTGPGGRITRGDVEAYLEAGAATPTPSTPAMSPQPTQPAPASPIGAGGVRADEWRGNRRAGGTPANAAGDRAAHVAEQTHRPTLLRHRRYRHVARQSDARGDQSGSRQRGACDGERPCHQGCRPGARVSFSLQRDSAGRRNHPERDH